MTGDCVSWVADSAPFFVDTIIKKEKKGIRMKKGQIFEGIVETIEFPNKGIITVEDRKITVKNVLKGQKVRFSIKKLKSGRGDGHLLEVLEKAENEIESPCPHFIDCGGCTYQNLPYNDQLKMKEQQIHSLLENVLSVRQTDHAWKFEGIKASPIQTGYRNKMEFSFGDSYKGGPLSLGMHKRGSFYDIVSVPECQIVDEDYRLVLKTVLDFFQMKNTGFLHRQTHAGFLRHLLVRKAKRTEELLIALVTTSQEQMDLNELKDALLSIKGLSGKIAGILHTVNDSLADVVKSDETHLLYGQDYFYEELLGLKFKISQFSFFQTNSLGAEVLYETAREFIGDLNQDGKEDTILFDLYSGTGTIAQMLAPVAGKVIGVEIVEEAVEAAKENAALNGLTNCEFIAGDVLKVLDQISEKPDFIILDPPREGIHPKALTKIIHYQVDRILYISCKPTSLVRDLEVFLESGYRVERACAVDLFPSTVHVETVVLITRVNKQV